MVPAITRPLHRIKSPHHVRGVPAPLGARTPPHLHPPPSILRLRDDTRHALHPPCGNRLGDGPATNDDATTSLVVSDEVMIKVA